MPPGAVYVGRGTKWGNPFRVGDLVADPGPHGLTVPYDGIRPPGTYNARRDGDPCNYVIRPVRDAADAVDLFRAYITHHHDTWNPETIRRELGGKTLACWCKTTDPCHADVLLRLSNDDGQPVHPLYQPRHLTPTPWPILP
jgi:Domain of unknown function (DUF4326)